MHKELRAGAVIASQYVLERELGTGGMGVVWAAEKVSDRTKVALKFLRTDRPRSESVCQRFLQEARAARRINHAGVVQIHDVVEDGTGLPVLVMDLLVGETLASRLEREGPMTAEDAIELLLPAADAVAAAHDQRIIHRDLKPENLFLCTREGQAPEVRVLDFGIAKVMRDDPDGARSGVMTSTGVVLGTPFYMAPEQLFSEGQIDERSDVWAFGVILYECIAGRRPFVGPSVGQVLRLIALDEYTPLSHAAANDPPPAVCDLVQRMLARDRTLRPRTMREVERLLQDVREGTYEFSLPFAATQRSPAASTGGVEPARVSAPAPVSTTNSSSRSRIASFLPSRRAKAVPLGVGALVVAAALVGVARLRTAAPAGEGGASVASSPPAIAAAAPASAAHVAIAPPAAASTAASLPSGSPAVVAPARNAATAVAARLPPPHSLALVDASASPAPAPSAAAGEPARRPGSVVDVPPF
jgi:serine/threonine-protein kinase